MRQNQVFHNAIIYACGAFITLFGTLVMLGWLTHTPWLIQLSPHSIPMQVNTAFSLFLSGIGILLARKKPVLSGILGLFIATIGSLTLVEYIFSINLNIDNVISHAYLTIDSNYPGRPAPNTAFYALILGLLLIFRFPFLRFNFKNLLTISLCFLLISAGLTSIAGHLFGMISLHGWGKLIQMSPHYALGLVLAGLALFYVYEDEYNQNDYGKISILSITVTMIGASLFLIMWQILSEQENKNITAVVAYNGNTLAKLFASELDHYYLELSRMQQREFSHTYTSLDKWKLDAHHYLSDFPSIESFALYSPNKKLYAESFRNDQITKDAKNNLNQCMLLSTLSLLSDKKSLCIPMATSQENFLLSIINLNTIMAFIVQENKMSGYNIALSTQNNLIYFHENSPQKMASALTYTYNFSFKHLHFQLHIWPSQALVDQLSNILPIIRFIAGNIITLLIAIMIWLLNITKKRQEQLSSTTQKFKSIMNSSHLSIITADLNGIITTFNRSAERILGYKAEEMIGKKTPVIFHDNDEIEKHSRVLSKKYNKNIPPGFKTFVAALDYTDVDEHEWTYIGKNGEKTPVLLSVTPIKTNGKISGYVGVALDISERKALEKMKNEFISVVSHELRTPLTSIHAAISLLIGKAMGELPTDVKSLLNIALKNSERLIRLINDILDVEKIEAGKMEFSLEPLEINSIIEESIVENKTFANQFFISLVFKKNLPTVFVQADHDRLLQVLANLLSNAIKFSKKNSDVIISTKILPNNMIRVEVTDKGAGIPDSFQPRIFSKFSQADSSPVREHQGTGLGLSITKAIIEKLHGSIGFKTTSHEGTVFYFDLPIIGK